jgi:DNA-binding transcriptional LysR family regulator
MAAHSVMLPTIVPGFLQTYLDIELEVVADDRLVDVRQPGQCCGDRAVDAALHSAELPV